MNRVGSAVIVFWLALAGLATVAAAQEAEKEPIGRFAVDARVALPRFKEDAATATALGVTTDNLPSRGLGLATGVTLYPVRLGKVALGVGGEWLVFSSGSKTLEPQTTGGADGPTVQTHFSVLSPQVSLNFGGRDGWSYVSGGMGWAAFTTELETSPVADSDGSTRAINYGGGARWFAKPHLAFTFDLRFYKINPQDAAPGRPAYGGRRMMVFSAGISMK
jgi:Outer membrane protein beta-barrel domain